MAWQLGHNDSQISSIIPRYMNRHQVLIDIYVICRILYRMRHKFHDIIYIY
jgi:hypothetical protein